MNNKLFMEGHELAVLNRYYIWLINMVDFDSHSNYSKCLEYLHNKNYIYDNDLDENRAEDGLSLRIRFEDETDYQDYSPLTRPCSVLEMLIAFAERINNDVMDGDYSTSYWFWIMLANLGCLDVDWCMDECFDAKKLDILLDGWMKKVDGSSEIWPMNNGKKVVNYQKKSMDEWMHFQAWVTERGENW